MPVVPPNLPLGVATITVLFVVATVFGRLHGSGGNGRIPAVGDRVMSGLLAIPLIVLLVRLTFPDGHVVWSLLAPAPLAWYVVLLAGTDLGWRWCRDEQFTRSLLYGVGFLYAVTLAVWLFQAA